ncbi:RidA family protein [Pandoraea fibrosis]|uniref:Endoribonuclease L-PSP n=1 Tax=Pandoraea fibrosis TaxID=1891094 RepID=A0A5E4S5A5_9BURK|nr:RidA family protein [Pandoraea fibrosis]QHE92587.1 RidA family protein [Pandoraea fibrosis]QHF13857.1 RidA family protein [Pandoraea fibrosis]VVD69328.1 endoribonuclease L-PSP [Pandoraea fibrosis]
MRRDELFQQVAERFAFPLNDEIKIGGKYTPVLLDGDQAYVAGQIPRMGDTVHFVGDAGGSLSLEEARRAAGVSALRALTLIQRACGSLDAIVSVPRISVFVRSAPAFTLQSEVADGASDVLFEILGEAGVHTRTSVGVLQLPKGAVVEVDFIFRVRTANT